MRFFCSMNGQSAADHHAFYVCTKTTTLLLLLFKLLSFIGLKKKLNRKCKRNVVLHMYEFEQTYKHNFPFPEENLFVELFPHAIEVRVFSDGREHFFLS